MINSFDYDNDTQYANYFLYKNKLINVRTYEYITKLGFKTLLPANLDYKNMVRKNRILQNKKEFKEFKINFKEYRYIDGIDYLIGLNNAIVTCTKEFEIKREYLLGAVSIFAFQIFSRQDAVDVLMQNNFKNTTSLFLYLYRNEYLIRIDNLSLKTPVAKRLYSISNKGITMIKRFYSILEKATVSDFKFKSKNELIIDDILKKYE
jgi:hypothetical protein